MITFVKVYQIGSSLFRSSGQTGMASKPGTQICGVCITLCHANASPAGICFFSPFHSNAFSSLNNFSASCQSPKFFSFNVMILPGKGSSGIVVI